MEFLAWVCIPGVVDCVLGMPGIDSKRTSFFSETAIAPDLLLSNECPSRGGLFLCVSGKTEQLHLISLSVCLSLQCFAFMHVMFQSLFMCLKHKGNCKMFVGPFSTMVRFL